MASRQERIEQLRALADELEAEEVRSTYKGIDPAKATDADIEWLRQMGRTDVLRAIEFERSKPLPEVQAPEPPPPGPLPDNPPAPERADIGEMTVEELKSELRAADQPVSGSKDELQDRVRRLRAGS